jgi:hypothetical protein
MLLVGSNPSTGSVFTFSVSGTETLRSGYTNVTIEIWGETGQGGYGDLSDSGGGGGSGGYSRITYTLAALGGVGKTLVFTLGTGGTATASSVVAGTATGFTTMTAGAGGSGTHQRTYLLAAQRSRASTRPATPALTVS